jgi:hypothetical protein
MFKFSKTARKLQKSLRFREVFEVFPAIGRTNHSLAKIEECQPQVPMILGKRFILALSTILLVTIERVCSAIGWYGNESVFLAEI